MRLGLIVISNTQKQVVTLTKQEAQLMLTNPRDAFTPGMVSY